MDIQGAAEGDASSSSASSAAAAHAAAQARLLPTLLLDRAHSINSETERDKNVRLQWDAYAFGSQRNIRHRKLAASLTDAARFLSPWKLNTTKMLCREIFDMEGELENFAAQHKADMDRARAEMATLRRALAHAEEREQYYERRALEYERQLSLMAARLDDALSLTFPPPPTFEPRNRRKEAEEEEERRKREAKLNPKGPPSREEYMARGSKFELRSRSPPSS